MSGRPDLDARPPQEDNDGRGAAIEPDEPPEGDEVAGGSGDDADLDGDLGGDLIADEGGVLAAEEGDAGSSRTRFIHGALGVASLGLSAVSIVAALAVVAIVRRGLADAEPDHAALLQQADPWFGVAVVSFVAALAMLVTWGLLGLLGGLRSGRGSRSAAPAAVGVAFVAVAWALSLHRQLG